MVTHSLKHADAGTYPAKSALARMIPLLARGIAPTAAVASGLISPLALGASGDLDPAFADVGRLGPIENLSGPAWSLQVPTDDDGIIVAGGNFDEACSNYAWYCYYDFDATGFLGRLSDAGLIDRTVAGLEDIEVLDVALQPDGKAVAVGRAELEEERTALTVFRLERDGSLDPTFGQAGIVRFPTEVGARHSASSVVLDPDGRIVIAGSRDGELVVIRLLQDGRPDPAFGDAGVGVFVGPPNEANGGRTAIVRTALGSYRIAANLRDFRNFNMVNSPCMVVGLTANGVLDGAFGSMGIARLDATTGELATCSAMIAQPDGKLLLAGSDAGQGFAARLLPSGQRDSAFAANDIADAMEDATALGIGEGGSVLVAGRGPAGVTGALLMRLQSNGELDALFGNAGSTWIDLPSSGGTIPFVHDMAVLPDGRVIAAGGDLGSRPARPFFVRLVGEGGDGPGVLGMARSVLDVKEEDQQAVLTVRRTGGDEGSVSVAYETVTPDSPTAIGGQDFTRVSGRLQWSDGDATERQIVVPISSDTAPEGYEQFSVALSAVQGGAGLGTRNATVAIAPDGDPGGQLSLETGRSVAESSGTVRVDVRRDFHFMGAVSVTLTPVARNATAGDDFAADPVTLTWSDAEAGSKSAEFAIRNDSIEEQHESFNVVLSNPTGGAILGLNTTATIIIVDNDRPAAKPPGGGGWFGFLSVLFLGLAGFVRSAWRRASKTALPSVSRDGAAP
jgi:uncharacterized delta-60 repeat protein